MNLLTVSQQNAVNAGSRTFQPLYDAGGGLGQLLNDIITEISGGEIGIKSLAADVDSVTLNGGAIGYDADNTTGLVFANKSGRVYFGGSLIAVSAGTIALAASQTNYVEVDKTGTVYTNTSAFTAGRCPLYTVLTGSSAITTVTNSKTVLFAPGPATITGTQLSTTASKRSVSKDIASISATQSFIFLAPCTGTLSAARFVSAVSITQSDTNYWSFGMVNKSNSNAAMLDTGADNSTKVTGGAAQTGYTPRVLVNSATGGNLIVNENDVIEVTITMTAAPTTMTEGSFKFDFAFTI
jgi:hypothetical protein